VLILPPSPLSHIQRENVPHKKPGQRSRQAKRKKDSLLNGLPLARPKFQKTMFVEETLATPASFRFNGRALVTSHELPTTGPWPADLTNQRLIQVEQGIHFHFEWSVGGVLVPLLDRGMKWKIQLFFEKWGQSESSTNPSATVNYVPTSGHTYRSFISIPANTISEGVYDVVAVLRLYDSAGNPLPVAG
jgi:hypothetical protein